MRCVTTIAIWMAMTCGTAAAIDNNDRSDRLPVPDMLVLSLHPSTLLPPSIEPDLRAKSVPQHATIPDKVIRGIDVSHYQGFINWKEVATDPQVAYCYIKATEGSGYVDDCYETNVRQARQNGIKVGAYHFFSPTASPVSQLDNMTSVVDKKDNDLIPIIDVEKIARRANVNAFLQRLRLFLKLVENHYGVRPLIYTGANFYNKYLAGQFTEYKLMIAKYIEPEPVLKDKHAKMLMWQYTSTGSVKGIRGNCDQSMFLKDYNINDILIK